MKLVLPAAATLGALLLAEPAFGFCRTTTCDPDDEVCPFDDDGCHTGGFELRWPGRCVGWGVHAAGSPLRGISAEELRREVEAAFARWQNASCEGGGQPNLFFAAYVEEIECSESLYNSDARNANVWMFRDDDWPYARQENTIALTTTTYSLRNGDLYDADVELNSRDKVFTTDPDRVAAGEIDLASTITHEAGHFLGLAHNDRDAFVTMTPVYIGLEARTLEADDIAGVCAIYPPDSPASVCDFGPRHGFSTQCEAPIGSDESCACRIAGGRNAGPAIWPALAAAGALLAGGRRRWRAQNRR